MVQNIITVKSTWYIWLPLGFNVLKIITVYIYIYIYIYIYLAISLVLTLISADYDSCPKVNLLHEIFKIIFPIALFTGACLLN